VDEIGAQLAVQRASVYRLIREGELAALRVGRLWRVPAESLRAFIAAGGSPARP
jgi:excisionase family DNA binding protein